MPLTPEQEIIMRLKAREKAYSMFGRFLGVVSAAAMIFVVGWFIVRQIELRQKSRESLTQEMELYKNRLAGNPSPQNTPSTAPSVGRLPGTSDIVDYSQQNRAIANPDSAAPLAAGELNPSAVGASVSGIKNIETKQEAIAEIVKEYFSAKSVAEILPLVRDARRVRPMMEDYYNRRPFLAHTWKGLGWAMPVEEPGYKFAYVQALFTDSEPIHVIVEETDMGFFIDWESSVHYSEVGWQDFQLRKPEEPKTFRLLASKPDENQLKISDDGKRAILKLKHPAEDGIIYAEFDLTDPLMKPLVEQLDLCAWKDVPVILRLCYPGPTAPSQGVEIAGVEGKGWLILGRTRG